MDRKGKYVIQFYQNGKEVKANNCVIELKKEEFYIKVTLQNLKGVYLNASFERTLFDLPPHNTIDKLHELWAYSMAESDANEEKDLLIDDIAYSYWFYDKNQTFHRFDKEIQIKGKKCIATHTVDKLLLVGPKEGPTIVPIKDIDKDIFMLFFATNGESEEKAKEIMRSKYQIKWI